MVFASLLGSFLALVLLSVSLVSGRATPRTPDDRAREDKKILILGGGVTGVIAARTLHEQGHDNFVIIEAQNELGGRMMSHTFGTTGRQHTIELGANWIQGTQVGNGPKNPILSLAEKHKVKTKFSDFYGSMTTYDHTGFIDYLDVFNDAVDNYTTLTVAAGARVLKSRYAQVAEYYQFDWEYAQTPEQTSWIASSWAENFTFNSDEGGFSEDNLFSVDQRGFKTLIQEEAKGFIKPERLLFNHTVKDIAYSTSGVKITMTDGKEISADYALCTFSVGVLQNDDVVFKPALPEAIQSMSMATYTKIFLQFSKNFWFDTQFALYADGERGRYPVWQSLDLKDFFPGSGIVFVTVTGDFSERVESLADSEVQYEVMGVLRSMFPNATIPDPEGFYFPRWFSDPLYRGSYSNWPSSFYSDHHENLRATVDQRLWFAGEATSMKWFGFLHGAYYEGVGVAKAMVECIEAGGCFGLEHVKEVVNGRPYKV